MSAELVPSTNTSPARLATGRQRLKRMAQRSIKSAIQAGELLPDVIEQLGDRIKSGEMEDKYLINAGSFLERVSQQRALVAKAAGLKTGAGGASEVKTIVNVNLRPELPLAERLRLIEQEVQGIRRIEAVVTSTPVEAKPSQGLSEPSGSTMALGGTQDRVDTVSVDLGASGSLSERIEEL